MTERSGEYRPLTRPGVHRQLCRELAIGEQTQKALADKYGVVPAAITDFKHRHWPEIEAIQASLDDPFAGMWIADKTARLQVLTDDVARIEEQEVDMADHQWMARKHAALKQAAEELGQLKTGLEASFTLRIEGVDLEALK